MMAIGFIDDDINFSAFGHKQTVGKSNSVFSPPYFPAQTTSVEYISLEKKPVNPPRPEVYYSTDKFGRTWRHENKKFLDDFVNSENQKPFQAQDIFGRVWQHNDKQVLEDFINKENSRQQQTYILKIEVQGLQTQTYLLGIK